MSVRQKDLGVILVHYHTPRLLAEAIECLRAEFSHSNIDGEIIVVDNGSVGSEATYLGKLADKYVKSERNLGYAGGINRGAMFSVAKNLVFMNPDVQVQAGCLGALVQELNAGADVVGPQFFWDKELTFFLPPGEKRTKFTRFLSAVATRGDIPKRVAREFWRRHAHRHWNASKPIRSFELSGALLLVSREAWNKVGRMDEAFKLYFEETDWLLRLKQAGLEARYVPQAKAYHAFNQSGRLEPEVGRWFASSQKLFEERYYGEKFCLFISRITRKASDINDNSIEPSEHIPVPDFDALGFFGGRAKWFEFSILPLGYPATACKLSDRLDLSNWSIDPALYKTLSDGYWEERVVNSVGQEKLVARFSKKTTGDKPELITEHSGGDEQRSISSLP